jgi:tetratricopeptide (TPR) repeat protein
VLLPRRRLRNGETRRRGAPAGPPGRDARFTAIALVAQSVAARARGDDAAGRSLCEQALALSKAAGEKWSATLALGNLGSQAFVLGETDRAAELLDQSLELLREIGDRWLYSLVVNVRARVARGQGDHDRALALHREGLTRSRDLRDHHGMALALDGMACVGVALGSHERAARLFGAESAVRERIGEPVWYTIRRDHERNVAAARGALGEAAWQEQWAIGRAMTLDSVVTYALAGVPVEIAPALPSGGSKP